MGKYLQVNGNIHIFARRIRRKTKHGTDYCNHERQGWCGKDHYHCQPGHSTLAVGQKGTGGRYRPAVQPNPDDGQDLYPTRRGWYAHDHVGMAARHTARTRL